MEEGKITIKINGKGLSIEKEINHSQLVKVMSVVFTDTNKQGFSEGTVNVADNADRDTDTKLTSLNTFMSDLDVSNNFKKIAAITLYNEEVLGNQTLHKDDIPEWFRKAGLSVPKNLTRDIRYAIRKNLIAEDYKQSDVYYITKSGKQTLELSEE